MGAVVGLGIALALAPRLPCRPAFGQIPGYAGEHGFDPRTDILRLLILVAFPVLGGAAAAAIALRRSSWPLKSPHGLAFFAAAAAAHALSVWIFLVVPLVPRGVPPIPLLLALMIVSLCLAAVLGNGDPGRGAAFLASACPILPLALFGHRPPVLWLAAGAAGLALPIFARAVAVVLPGIVRGLRVLALAILLPGSVTALAAAALFHGPPVADVFEDGHGLLPASEYLRGELPYRDIVPGHGLVSDGLLQAAQLKLFGDDYRGIWRGTKISGAVFWPAFYALGYAATGSPAFGFLGLLFSFIFFPQYQFPRAVASLGTLALAVYASRTKKGGAWLPCGVGLIASLCVSVDFAAYAAGGVAVALWVARGRRRDHLRRLLLGVLVSGGALALALGSFGILGGFLRTTFVFVPSLLPAYAQGFPPLVFPKDAAGVWALANRTTLLYGFTALSILLLGALLPRAPRVGSRARAMLPVLAWAALAMLSVLERQHVGYPMFAVPIGLLLLQRWFRGWRPWRSPRSVASFSALILIVWKLRPLLLMVLVADAIAHPRVLPDTQPLDEPQRAHGAVFRAADASLIRATADMMRRAGFRKEDTWLDFASAPGLYYLFDRDCPIRYYEVPFYESEKAQREVIEAVAGNPRVRAVLMASGLFAQMIDGVPSSTRAPLVAAFIRERFRPFYREGAVEFWLRKE